MIILIQILIKVSGTQPWYKLLEVRLQQTGQPFRFTSTASTTALDCYRRQWCRAKIQWCLVYRRQRFDRFNAGQRDRCQPNELWMRLSYPVNPDSPSNNFFCNRTTAASFWPRSDPDNITLRFVPDGPCFSTVYQLIGTPGLKKQNDNKSIFQQPNPPPPARPTQVPIWMMGWRPIHWINGADWNKFIGCDKHGLTVLEADWKEMLRLSFGGSDYLEINITVVGTNSSLTVML